MKYIYLPFYLHQLVVVYLTWKTTLSWMNKPTERLIWRGFLRSLMAAISPTRCLNQPWTGSAKRQPRADRHTSWGDVMDIMCTKQSWGKRSKVISLIIKYNTPFSILPIIQSILIQLEGKCVVLDKGWKETMDMGPFYSHALRVPRWPSL